jgi:hypothetical protein
LDRSVGSPRDDPGSNTVGLALLLAAATVAIAIKVIYPDAFIVEVEVFMNATVSILAEIPEELHESLQSYLESHPDWDQDRVFSAALSLFLLQSGSSETPSASRSYRRAARVYLDTVFKHAV